MPSSPYITHTEVKEYFLSGNIGITGSLMSDAQADAVCVTEQAEVDAVLETRAGYTVPITGTNALAIVKKLVALRAAAECWRRLHITSLPDQPTMADKWRAEADKMLADIVSGDLVLVDAAKPASASISSAPRVTTTTEIFPRSSTEDFASTYGSS